MQYRIVELAKKDASGLVGHSVLTPDHRLAKFVSYDDARALIESRLQDGDTVTEEYQSGRQVSYTAAEFRAEQENIRKRLGIGMPDALR